MRLDAAQLRSVQSEELNGTKSGRENLRSKRTGLDDDDHGEAIHSRLLHSSCSRSLWDGNCEDVCYNGTP
ncbi:hypothetical protein QQF64_029595 [Cirrhinus molitorella]|uniref:Uncharacterized protein n=1 Tax=Cirrhinus molitorella TaxID=172907 RepID=A0ABR3N109_9TELE